MSFSAARLTCFALISALEQDLQDNIHQHLIDQELLAVLSNAQVERAQARRGRDQAGRATIRSRNEVTNTQRSASVLVTGSETASINQLISLRLLSLPALLPYLDFSDGYEVLLHHRNDLPVTLVEQLEGVSKKLERLTAIRNRVAHTRPMEIDDLSNVLDIAQALCGLAIDHWPETRETLARLQRDPAYVLGLRINLPAEPSRGPVHNLPVPDFDETGFFGRRLQVNRVKRIIKGPYPVVSILGDGGIGKTSVALKVAYELLDDPNCDFDAIVWVSAKATVLTVHEIERINGAIEDSLGLFVKAAEELGSNEPQQEPVEGGSGLP